MYLVIGNSPRKVELKDLNDCVYYKQQKVYSDAQYNRSIDLQRAIQNKVLVVLKKSEEATGSFDIPSVIAPSEVNISESSDNSKNLELLLDRVHKLEASLNEKKSVGIESQLLERLIDRIEKLENNPAPIPENNALFSLQESIKNIETKLQEKNKGDEILDRLEGIISRSGSGTGTKIEDNVQRRVEEVYIPNLTVEDANSHIKLEVRSIESGDSVSESLKKLKELRSKSK